MNKYFATPITHTLDLQSYFGQHKNYDLFLLKSNAIPIRMAAELGALFQRPFSFLGQIALTVCDMEFDFPLFYSMLHLQNGANLVLMPNKATIPAENLSDAADPLIGLPLFDEDAYIFNKHGRFTFPSEFQDYDYLLLLSADKGYQGCEQVRLALEGAPQIKWQNISALMEKKGNKKIEKDRVAFLQRLFIDADVMVTGFQEEWVKQKLCGVTTIPDYNYALPRFPGIPVSLQPLFDTPLMRRPDY